MTVAKPNGPVRSVAHSDSAILARVAQGDVEALGLLYDRYAPSLMRFARRLERNEAEDIIPTKDHPVPLALACTRKLKDGEQKAVLFGDSWWAQDRVAFMRDFFGGDRFPANAELLVNSLLWLAGTEHLITVSPETLEARRIEDPGAWTLPIQLATMIGIPVAVLAAGVIVYAVRRR